MNEEFDKLKSILYKPFYVEGLSDNNKKSLVMPVSLEINSKYSKQGNSDRMSVVILDMKKTNQLIYPYIQTVDIEDTDKFIKQLIPIHVYASLQREVMACIDILCKYLEEINTQVDYYSSALNALMSIQDSAIGTNGVIFNSDDKEMVHLAYKCINPDFGKQLNNSQIEIIGSKINEIINNYLVDSDVNPDDIMDDIRLNIADVFPDGFKIDKLVINPDPIMAELNNRKERNDGDFLNGES
ncbi:MAG: hypothetical protein BAJALOKI3v1_50051 [Promethearchaeota archaeon]|nr:MAG: hypothetical protein BAJALOKI3v1_50051 [Candidatus Lokiarchaeota archaeon]